MRIRKWSEVYVRFKNCFDIKFWHPIWDFGTKINHFFYWARLNFVRSARRTRFVQARVKIKTIWTFNKLKHALNTSLRERLNWARTTGRQVRLGAGTTGRWVRLGAGYDWAPGTTGRLRLGAGYDWAPTIFKSKYLLIKTSNLVFKLTFRLKHRL
jgi:hypothetical protein